MTAAICAAAIKFVPPAIPVGNMAIAGAARLKRLADQDAKNGHYRQ